jgi:GNAT acetyltransferase-like protein
VGIVSIQDYTERDRARWDTFVTQSKNGTFLFSRDYMDYHADRYPDASLMGVDDGGALRALLPATRRGEELISHAGLTYGGFVTDERMTTEAMLELFDATVQHLSQSGISKLSYKAVPHIYHRTPAEEDLYALMVNGAELYRRDVLSVIDYEAEIDWEARRRRRQKKSAAALRAGIEVRETDDYEAFWVMLAANLDRRHNLKPVHTSEEIQLLADRFPDHIRFFGAYRGDRLEAGAVLYLSPRVCHVQYSASSVTGRKLRALDLVHAHIIDAFHTRARYYDFGISTEQEGRVLNAGLVEYKQQFGARTVVQDHYRVSIPKK